MWEPGSKSVFFTSLTSKAEETRGFREFRVEGLGVRDPKDIFARPVFSALRLAAPPSSRPCRASPADPGLCNVQTVRQIKLSIAEDPHTHRPYAILQRGYQRPKFLTNPRDCDSARFPNHPLAIRLPQESRAPGSGAADPRRLCTAWTPAVAEARSELPAVLPKRHKASGLDGSNLNNV